MDARVYTCLMYCCRSAYGRTSRRKDLGIPEMLAKKGSTSQHVCKQKLKTFVHFLEGTCFFAIIQLTSTRPRRCALAIPQRIVASNTRCWVVSSATPEQQPVPDAF